ncbi:LLM class F420-dependent oxidoreductase [Branchiibius sp. NY16-3462-2]|uniref:LLM class F420-dependent oxidoreductase n=1 Tax=Branchiibius sp. NY16-3462-2 TaxID=1807500 RepID=UPI000793A86A|nr:LLM class F420-dependent oxidoreductase [Branchiibius sp. NY16-3462-2]KYH43479.1 LLM class F420-dependent oxidoreductase [Branchiibius sp. NY16-3462-2]
MDLRIFTEPQQGATYDDLLKVAQATELLGFDAFFRSDHYLTMGGDGLPGPTDAWLTLAALARETHRIRLGTLVTSATFRHPGPLAVSVAQVDQMSGGRVEFGYGAGWFEAEHAAYGIPFPPLGERFDRLEEALAVITGLWSTPVGETFTYAGTHLQVTDSPALPKPAQTSIPVIIGGTGKKRTPALAAAYADEFNVPFHNLDEVVPILDRVRAAVAAAGRPAESMTYSVAQVVCLGGTDAQLAKRAEAIGRSAQDVVADGLGGTAEQILSKLAAFADAGISRVYLQVLDLQDLDHLEQIADQVLRRL